MTPVGHGRKIENQRPLAAKSTNSPDFPPPKSLAVFVDFPVEFVQQTLADLVREFVMHRTRRGLEGLQLVRGQTADFGAAGFDRFQISGFPARRFLALEGSKFDGGVSDNFLDRKSTRLNSSHTDISYAVFCLKKKKKT